MYNNSFKYRRQRSNLEVELQNIHDERKNRRNTYAAASQIPFLEMDLNGLYASRTFSNRKMLSYLTDYISTFDSEAEQPTQLPDKPLLPIRADSKIRRCDLLFTTRVITIYSLFFLYVMFVRFSKKLSDELIGDSTASYTPRLRGRRNSSDIDEGLPYNSRLRMRRNSSGYTTKRIFDILPLQLKDIRRIEYVFNSAAIPLILVRRHCVVISFTPIRIIVSADRLLLFQQSDLVDSDMKDLFIEQLKVNLGTVLVMDNCA